MESWLIVPGYEQYEVSDLGRVKSLAKEIIQPWGVRHRKEKQLKGAVTWDGYRKVWLYKEGIKVKPFLIHRLVMLAFVGPSDLQVNHKDLNKQNNTLDNLEYTSNLANMKHARLNKPRWALRGNKHPNKKITFDEMVEILFMRMHRIPNKCIAEAYGIRDDYIKQLKFKVEYRKAMLVVHKLLTPSHRLLN